MATLFKVWAERGRIGSLAQRGFVLLFLASSSFPGDRRKYLPGVPPPSADFCCQGVHGHAVQVLGLSNV